MKTLLLTVWLFRWRTQQQFLDMKKVFLTNYVLFHKVNKLVFLFLLINILKKYWDQGSQKSDENENSITYCKNERWANCKIIFSFKIELFHSTKVVFYPMKSVIICLTLSPMSSHFSWLIGGGGLIQPQAKIPLWWGVWPNEQLKLRQGLKKFNLVFCPPSNFSWHLTIWAGTHLYEHCLSCLCKRI